MTRPQDPDRGGRRAGRRAGRHRRDVRGRGGPEQDRCDDSCQVGIDLSELEVHSSASWAIVEVFVDPRGVASRQSFANPRSEPFGDPAAVLVAGIGQVHLQVGLTKTFARPICEGGDAVRCQSEKRSDIGRLLTLDLKVPQDELPALGQGREGLGGRSILELLNSRIGEWHPWIERLQIVGRGDPRRCAKPVDMQASYRGQQVGTEGHVGSATAAKHAEHLHERVGHQVVGVTRPPNMARQR